MTSYLNQLYFFSTREIATLFWLTLALAAFSANQGFRVSAAKIVGLLAAPPLRTILLAQMLYVLLILSALKFAGLWDTTVPQVKAAMLWFFLVGSVSTFRAQKAAQDPDFFKKAIKDNLRIIIALEFILAFYSYSLITELIMMPIVVLVVGVQAVSSRNEEHRNVEKLMSFLLACIGFSVFANTVHQLIDAPSSFFQTQTFIDFYTPPLLSTLFLPFVYGLSVYMAYEQVYLRLGYNCADDMLSRAKLKAALAFKWRVKDLDRWSTSLNYERVESIDDLERTISGTKAQIAYEKSPMSVDPEDGWSPYEAMSFLSAEGFDMGHYRSVGADDWSSGSNVVSLGSGFLTNSATFRVTGDRFVAHRLALKASIQHPNRPQELARFAELSEVLLSRALGGEANTNLLGIIERGENAEGAYGNKLIALKKENWPNFTRGEHDLTLEISVNASDTV